LEGLLKRERKRMVLEKCGFLLEGNNNTKLKGN